MSIQDEKQMIRNQIRARRAQLDTAFLNEIKKALPDYVLGIEDDEYQKRLSRAKRVALYRSAGGEVPVDELAQALMRRGIKCCFPKIVDGEMRFYDCADLSSDRFSRGSFGILEPITGADAEAIAAEAIDIAVVPGIAYNDEGYRLGQGKGYYDRFFAETKAYLVAVCYDFEMYSAIPVESHDLCVDLLLPIETSEEDD